MKSLTLRLLFALVLAAGLSMPAAAQESGDGTIYSRFGLGELRSYSSSRAYALGGGTTAMSSFEYLNLDNPASWSSQVLVRLAGGASYQALEASNAEDQTSTLVSGAFDGLSIGVPLLAGRLGIAAAFVPVSRVSYRATSGGTLIDPVQNDTTAYTLDLQGSGGLQSIRVGAGYRAWKNVSVGASADFVFGILGESQETSFTQGAGASPDFLATTLENETRLRGVTGTIGVHAALPALLRERDVATLGVSFRLPTSLDADRVLTLGESLDRDTLRVDGRGLVDGSVDLPWQAQFGATYQPSGHLLFVLDGLYAPWTDFSSSIAFPGYENGDAGAFRDRLRASGGVEWVPAGTRPVAPYVERVAYRLGAFYERGYVSPTADSPTITTMGLVAGLGLPTVVPGTRLDLHIEAGQRGTTDDALIRDRYLRIGVHVNLGERWFVKRKLR